jgi:hypothetical protein
MPDSSMLVTRREHAWRGYALAALAATCWATGGLTAKWLFTAEGPDSGVARPAARDDRGPVVLSGARAFTLSRS